jgi:chemotaxis protein MotB
MNDDCGAAGGVPASMVTFADMMSLLLTFFVMLVSFSELQSEEKYQALLDSFHQQFGYQRSQGPLRPGELRPRNPALARTAAASRARTRLGRVDRPKVQAPAADRPQAEKEPQSAAEDVKAVLYFQKEPDGSSVQHRQPLTQHGR